MLALTFRSPLRPKLPFAFASLSESCSLSAELHSNENEVYLIFPSLLMTRSLANDSISQTWLAN